MACDFRVVEIGEVGQTVAEASEQVTLSNVDVPRMSGGTVSGAGVSVAAAVAGALGWSSASPSAACRCHRPTGWSVRRFW